MVSKKSRVQKKLRNWLSDAEKVVVAGIGNPLRMDDFVGVRIIQDLHGRVSEKVYLIECETVPESFIQQIIDFYPTHILLIDAAILGSKPSSWELVNLEQLAMLPVLSTHTLPLRIFCEYLTKVTRAKIALLAIQPKDTDFGEGLSAELQKTAKSLTDLLLNFLP